MFDRTGLKRGMLALTLIFVLSACGGGSSGSAVSTLAAAIGVTPQPVPAPAPAPTPTPTAAAPTFANGKWVDFQNGNDNNDGLSKATAWKHSPGDPSATGVAGAYRPQPGDQIVFAAGSRYFGSITAQFTGTAARPITLTGESDTNPSVIDGTSLSATVTKCASQSACHGIAAWQNASVAVFKDPLPEGTAFFAGDEMLTPAQWPDPKELFYAGELSAMADVAGTAIAAGAIDLPSALGSNFAFAPGMSVAVWVQPNVIEQRPVTAITGGKVIFDATGLTPYTDRTDKFALRGNASLISMAGEFAILPDRKTVLFVSSRNVSTLTAATGRTGIDVSGASNVVIKKLAFENFADVAGQQRTGLPVWALRLPATDVTVEGNSFRNLFLSNGLGAVTVFNSRNVAVRANSISTVAEGSGLRMTQNTNLLVERNHVERVGRTGIYLQTNTDSLVLRNRVRDVRGVHGNGLSIYLGNLRTRVIANTVTEATRPMTIRGNNTADPAFVDALIANNLLVTMEDSLGAFVTYGANSRNVRLLNNVILGAKKGSVRLAEGDHDLRVERNVIDGITFNGAYHSDWTIRNNVFRSLGVFQDRYTTDTVTAGLPAAFNTTGIAPSDLSVFCRYISEPLDLIFGTRYDRNVGAEFTCS